MNLGCFALERGVWSFREVEELKERTFLTCPGEEGREAPEGPWSPILAWQAGGGGFGLCLGWGLGCVDPSGASWSSQECWDPWAVPQDQVQNREGAPRALQASGQSWEVLPEPSSDVKQILQGLIQTSPHAETSSSCGLSTLRAGNYTCKAVIALLSN